MRGIEPYQLRKIYAIGNALKITEPGEKDDELHLLVCGLTGKESLKNLTYQEAVTVIDRLEQLHGDKRPTPYKVSSKRHEEKPGGVTSSQQKKVWALMYDLQKYDTVPSQVGLGDRLCAAIKKELGTDATAKNPFAWITFEQGNSLIEILKRYVASAKRKEDANGSTNGRFER